MHAAALVAAPLILIAWAVAALSHFIQVGWLFSPQLLAPKLSKLNPIHGVKRILSMRGAMKTLMDSGKVAVVVLIALVVIGPMLRDIIMLPLLELLPAALRVGRMLFDLALYVSLALLILGLLDLWHQRWRHRRDMRMSKQQVKDEMRQSDGDPEVKRRQIRMRQQIMMQRLNAAVPRADVIVTNPEHVAVAIQYDQARMNAPKVVAKGADLLAMRIRQLALRHGIPIIERKPLARALYAQVEVNQEIPAEFYQAVAEILAYVYRLSGRSAA
jgi:flagellar biosynthesis protein FlhB